MLGFTNSAEKFLSGQILLFDKPAGLSSFNVVKKVRCLIKKKHGLQKIKVGHAGTLDPLATGLLIICTGKLTKQISKIQAQEKIYSGTIRLGGATASYDLETTVDYNYETSHINEKLIRQTAKKFTGNIKQKPPIFSALKYNGERLYEKARRGEKIKIKKRVVSVHYFNIINIKNLDIDFEIKCSTGTYIRSIAHDFGSEINSGGHLLSLCRTAIGNYKLLNAMTIQDFEALLNG